MESFFYHAKAQSFERRKEIKRRDACLHASLHCVPMRGDTHRGVSLNGHEPRRSFLFITQRRKVLQNVKIFAPLFLLASLREDYLANPGQRKEIDHDIIRNNGRYHFRGIRLLYLLR